MEDLIFAIKNTLEKIKVSGREDVDKMLGVFIALDKLSAMVKEIEDGKSTD